MYQENILVKYVQILQLICFFLASERNTNDSYWQKQIGNQGWKIGYFWCWLFLLIGKFWKSETYKNSCQKNKQITAEYI